MNNEEKVLAALEQLAASVSKLEAGQNEIKTELLEFTEKQFKVNDMLISSIMSLNVKVDRLEAGQNEIKTELSDFKEKQFKVNDTHLSSITIPGGDFFCETDFPEGFIGSG